MTDRDQSSPPEGVIVSGSVVIVPNTAHMVAKGNAPPTAHAELTPEERAQHEREQAIQEKVEKILADNATDPEIIGEHREIWDQHRNDRTRTILSKRARQILAPQHRTCPYTGAEYDQAVQKAGTKQAAIARELNVDVKTLRKYGRPAT